MKSFETQPQNSSESQTKAQQWLIALASDNQNLPSKDEPSHSDGRIAGQQLAIFLDFDGTLTPIVENPDDAKLDQSMRDTLARLAECYPVSIVSGRDVDDVRQRVGLSTVFYAGSHGFDIAGPEGWHARLQKGEEFLPDLDEAEHALREALASHSDAITERKAFSIAVHYRHVADGEVTAVETAIDRVIAQHEGRLSKHHGKQVFQVQPQIDWDKGQAVLWLLDRLDLNRPEVLPLYIGDDTTDEDAFQMLRERPQGGLGLAIRSEGDRRDTAAHSTLNNPTAVRGFLENLLVGRTGDQA